MLRCLGKIKNIVLGGCFFLTYCTVPPQDSLEFCFFETDKNGRVEKRGLIFSKTPIEDKKKKIYKWKNEGSITKQLDLITHSKDSTSFSARVLHPFLIVHETETDTILEPTNLKYNIYIEITDTAYFYYLLDFQLYFETTENPWGTQTGRLKGYNDKEYLNKYIQHCNPSEEKYKELEELISKELRQNPRYFKNTPSKKDCEKHVLRIIKQAEEISKEAQTYISTTTNSFLNFLN